MWNKYKKELPDTRQITYHVLLSRERKVMCWKTQGRSWDILSNAPTALKVALANGIEIRDVREHPDGDGKKIGKVVVRAVISRQARWKRGRQRGVRAR